MYLKKLEILGFKSFANKTVVDFSKGMTAIVGPNGCGKTNILDALRWVLGEQKVSMLRGSKMEEVIFNGTRDAKPLGMAEVTLTLVNNRGLLPTEYHEVQITRRLFRSGDSEYLLNKVPCRLKDITELFFDTGMGAHSYSVIQQDMIEAVISDKAEERRFLFEEAAGITKYKQRKKAALRKLEATENDFLRLHDIYSEVQTQVRSLKRQQKKAERYQNIAEQVKNWDLYLSSNRVKEIETKKRELKATHDSIHDQNSQKDAVLDKLSSELESVRKEQIDLEHSLSQIGNRIFEITETAHEVEKQISTLQEKKSNSSDLIQRNESEIEALKIRKEMLTEQLVEIEETLAQNKAAITELETCLIEAQNDQAEADRNLLLARSSKEEHNKKMIELEGKLSSGRTEEDNLKKQEVEISELIEKLNSEISERNQDKENLAKEFESVITEKEKLSSQKESLDRKLKEKTEIRDNLQERNDNLSEDIAELNISIEASQARKKLLEEMILQYDGYESGVKAAMDMKDNWNGIFGTVAEKFIPVEGMEMAVEAALGDMAKFLVCDNRSTAESIISYLKDNNKGRIGIMVPDTGTINPVVKRPELASEHFVGWMDQFVSTDEQLKHLKEAVLSRTAVFKAGFKPDDILPHLPYGFTAVSTDGELFSKNIMTGGNDDRLPLFRRQEKVEQLEKSINELKEKLEQAKAEKNRTTAELASLRAELHNLTEEIESTTEELNNILSRYKEFEYQTKGFDNELSRLTRDISAQREKLETIKNRQYSLELNFGQLTDEKSSLVNSIAVSSEELGELESKASSAAAKLSSLQIKQVENRSRIEQAQSKLNHTNELIKEIDNSRETKANEIVSAKETIETSKDKIATFEEELKVFFNSRREATEEQSKLREQQSDIMEVVNAKEKLVKEHRSSHDELTKKLHEIEMQLNNLDSEVHTITEKIFDEYELQVSSVEVAYPDEEIAIENAKAHLHDLKEQLKKFGAVNLLALEEYKTASEREVFLKEQLDDLDKAKTDLVSTITKINNTAKELFEETLKKVRINFKRLFTELFTGGEADIYLKDPSDPLESDIEIFARPRGKKLVSITMMSGGERALTAISLLFSLYLVKPSPFCILDEIDAPLDDANCRRFLKIIETFSNQTQFILITHNKITMEASNNIYGITMEQLGISKLVAVKFNEVEKDGKTVTEQEVRDEDTEEINEFDLEEEPSNGNGHGESEEITEFDLSEELPDDNGQSTEEETPVEESELFEKEEFELIADEGNGNGHGNGNGNNGHSESEEDQVPESPDELPSRVVERMSETVNSSSTDEDNRE